jgi:hypothetical protein
MTLPTNDKPPRTLDANGQIAHDLPCANCRYNLRGLARSAVCPECAYPVASTAVGHRVRANGQGRFRTPLACAGCGSELLSLPPGGACPACGHPLADSIRCYHLPHAAPRWVAYLADGSLLLLAAGVLYGVLSLYHWVAAFHRWMNLDAYDLTQGVPKALLLCATVLGILGIILLTIRDPTTEERPEGFTARRVVRWSLVLAVVVGGIDEVWRWPAFVEPSRAMFLFIYHWGPLALRVVLPLALLRHVAALLRRVPSPGPVRFGLITFWCAVVVATMVVLGWAPTLPPLWGLWYAVRLVWEFAGYVTAVASLVGLVFLFVAARALSRTARQAAHNAAAVRATAEGDSTYGVTARDG